MVAARPIVTVFAIGLAGATLAAQTAGSAQSSTPASTPATREHGKVVARARADIKGQGISGTATLVEYEMSTGRWVEVTLQASGLTPGLHGVHLHAVGKCEPDFTAAGGHFDPGPAGNTDPDANHPFHMGDLPNLSVDSQGTGKLVAPTTRVTLSEGPLSVFDADGTAIILHGNQDQGITGAPKSGVSGGPRVACGVLVKE